MFNARKYLCVEKIFGGNLQRTERIKRGWRPAVSYLEVEDDGPDEAEGELGVAVHDVLAADVDKLDLLVAEEPQRRLHVLYRVETHATSLPRLQREKQLLSKQSCISENQNIENCRGWENFNRPNISKYGKI